MADKKQQTPESNKAILTWVSGMEFNVSLDNQFSLTLDASPKVGGQDNGPRPKPMLLTALGGCTGMDVIYFLRKMRSEPKEFKLEITGELTTEHPKYYKYVKVSYIFNDPEPKIQSIEKSVNLSKDKYCGVYEMFRKAGTQMDWEIIVNGDIIASGSYNK